MTPLSPGRTMTRRLDLNRVEFWLQFCFATIACLGGLILATGPGTEAIPVIAVASSVFGFVFVDRLKWFHLPPIAAYIAMGLAAVYCVRDFWEMHTTGNQQMVAVALLLVLVQAILMLERKTPRIFEQLAVFCLLQLVVGAVFNDAITFGLLLLPIAVFGAWGLSVMSSVAASEGIQSRLMASNDDQSDQPTGSDLDAVLENPSVKKWSQRVASHWMFRPLGRETDALPMIQVWSSDAIPSFASAAAHLQRFALATLAPAIVMVSLAFFYALPRTTDSARLGDRGRALVGFSENVRLEQFGEMLQSSATALRIEMTNRRTGAPYVPNGEIYLRGKVLEDYVADFDSDRPTAIWSAKKPGLISGRQRLPLEYIPSRVSDKQFFDAVDVQISTGSMQEASLFAVAPYHINGNSNAVVHAVDRWSVARKESAMLAYPPIKYGFGTNAFSEGLQTDLITRTSTLGRMMSSTIGTGLDAWTNGALVRNQDSTQEFDPNDRSAASRRRRYVSSAYLADLTEFDAAAMPMLAQLSSDIMTSIPPNSRTTEKIAKAFERHLATAGGYSYTLKLNAQPQPGVDPIEQFVATDRKGHCQYFASALAMMLRSVNIPARLVVGYRTNEYNDLGQYFVARQLHAHAWVEALIDRDQFDPSRRFFGQAPSTEYWLRLDPTPGTDESFQRSGGNVDQVMNMAENLWEKYVVSMDGRKRAVLDLDDEPSSWIAQMMAWFPRTLNQIRSGSLNLGSLSFPHAFSWQAAGLVIFLSIAVLGLIRLPWGVRLRNFIRKKPANVADKPSVAFYAEALAVLSQVGFTRRSDQTPDEFLREVTSGRKYSLPMSVVEPFGLLTREFYEACYAGKLADDQAHNTPRPAESLAQLRREVTRVLKNPELLTRITN
ncbi:MAG: transglutaminaseTgpA domain-containing protein [Pirellulaceae bacterium]